MATEKEAAGGSAQMAEGLITPEALEKWKERIGMKMRIGNQFNELASKDAIRHFCDGIGDPNPLFRDEEYAKKTRYGSIVAPGYCKGYLVCMPSIRVMTGPSTGPSMWGTPSGQRTSSLALRRRRVPSLARW
jgi:hypothetical protein